MRRRRSIMLVVDGAEIPSEFRLFVAGWNDTENGRYLFDEGAAEAVMAAYAAHEVDRMIDLEHLSLDVAAPNFDPDARGWCKLELREDGSLWAVDVKWTPDGQARLLEKRQRYISPAFEVDPKTKRVSKIINIALTALPATHGTPELVAARTARDRRTLSTGTSLNDIQRAIQAALDDRYPPPADGCGPRPWVCDVFDASAVFELDGKLFEVGYAMSGSTATLGAPSEVKRTYAPVAQQTPAATTTTRTRVHLTARAALSATGAAMDPELVKQALDALTSGDNEKAAELLKGLIAAAAGGEAATPPPGEELAGAPMPDEEQEEEQAAVMAATTRLVRLTGKATFTEAIDEVETWRTSHLKLEAETAKLAKEREALENAERRELCVKLVTLGGRAPANVWADDKAKKPKKYLSSMPIGDLREYVADALAARGKAPTTPIPPAGDSTTNVQGGRTFQTQHGDFTLSASELASCERKKIDPAKLAETRAGIRSRSTRSARAEV